MVRSAQNRWALVGLVGVSAVGVAIWIRSGMQHSVRALRADERAALRANTRTLSALPTRSFDKLLGSAGAVSGAGISFPLDPDSRARRAIDTLEGVLAEAPVVHEDGDPIIGDALAKSLLRVASEFVFVRFVVADPEAYIRWRMHRGDAFRPRDEMFGHWMVASDFESYFDQPIADDASVRDTFVAFFQYHDRRRADAHRVVGMSVEPDAMLLGVQRVGRDLGYGPMDLGSADRRAFWYEPRTGSHRCWFDSGIDHDRVDEMPSGMVGVTLQYADGSARPMMIVADLDPASGRWSIQRVWTNHRGLTGGLIEF